MHPIASFGSPRPIRRAAALLSLFCLSFQSLPVLAAAPNANALRPRTLPSKSLPLTLPRDADPRSLIVKLSDDAGVELRNGRLEAIAGGAFAPAKADRVAATVGAALARTPGVTIAPLIAVPRGLLDLLRRTGEARTGEALADLSQYYRVEAPAGRGAALLVRLLGLPEVENAYPYRTARLSTDVAPTTPSFVTGPNGQNYRNPAPDGIDVGAASAVGLIGRGVTIADVEQSWNLNHEDLDHLLAQVPPVPLFPFSGTAGIDHGTASIGVLSSGNNAYGTTGLAPAAKLRVVPILRPGLPLWSAPNAVVAATLALKAGDVMLLEVEDVTGAPFETFDVEFSVVRQATALGIHVVEPAGNIPNGTILDCDPSLPCNPDYLDAQTGEKKFDPTVRDSGAILVAGSQSAQGPGGGYHNRYINSNYGTRIDAYAWGQNVTTLGYGAASSTLANCTNTVNLFPAGNFDPNQRYTACYNGTSAAGSIVAGAVALLQGKVKAKWGVPATPRELRNHLRLGTPGGGGIGHMPDLSYHLNLYDTGGVISHSLLGELRHVITQSTSKLGSAMAGPGDLDGDGIGDIAVGAPAWDPTGTSVIGRVYVYSGKSEKVLWKVDGTVPQGDFGSVLAAIGDVDGDGIGDLAVGAPGDGFSLAGSVHVLSGVDGHTIYTLTQGAVADRFGAAIAPFPFDLNGDGRPEILVGSPGLPPTATNQGRIDMISGASGSGLWKVVATPVGSELGFAVAATGDLNGDGIPEVIAGAPREVDPATGLRPGAVHLLGGRNGKVLLDVRGEVPPASFNNSAFGSAVAGTGDLNGDGLGDFMVGAPGWTVTPGGANFGKVYLFKASSSSAGVMRSYTGTAHFQELGRSVAAVGDWNGDGLLDVAAGQAASLSSPCCAMPPGKVFVYLGPFNVPLTPALALATTKTFATQDTSTTFGTGVAALGDTNGDGRPDVGAGEPYYGDGRAFVFSSAPAPTPPAARLVADVPAIEARDVDGNGLSGGGLSPSSARFTFDAGPAFANGTYMVFGMPKAPFDTNPVAQGLVAGGSSYLVAFSGTLDALGQTTAPLFGNIPTGFLCPGLAGAEFDFVAGAGIDTNGDGILDQFIVSNPATVKIIWEWFPTC